MPPIRDRAGDVNEHEQLIGCPVCGDQNTHIDDVAVKSPKGTLRGHASGEDDSARITVELDYVANHGRRHSIAVYGWCESGHAWTWSWQQTKGSTWFSQQEGTS